MCKHLNDELYHPVVMQTSYNTMPTLTNAVIVCQETRSVPSKSSNLDGMPAMVIYVDAAGGHRQVEKCRNTTVAKCPSIRHHSLSCATASNIYVSTKREICGIYHGAFTCLRGRKNDWSTSLLFKNVSHLRTRSHANDVLVARCNVLPVRPPR